MLVLHHLELSQSFRILWLLEELGYPYDIKIYKRTTDNRAPEEYKAISPLGTSPTITDGDDVTLCESNAIMDYIMDKAQTEVEGTTITIDKAKTKQLRPPPGTPERTQYLFWFHASPGSFQLVMSTVSLFRIIPAKLFWPISSIFAMISGKVHENFIDPRLQAILKLAEIHLSQSDYLAGTSYLTNADITSIYAFDSAFDRFPELTGTYPACAAWLGRLRQRPAYQAALTKMGEDHVSLAL